MRANGSRPGDVLPALGEFVPDVLVGPWAFVLGQSHGQQARNHGDITDPVDQEAIPFSDRRDHGSRDGRPNEARGIEVRRIERDGVAEIGAVVNHQDDKRLARGNLDGSDDALEQASTRSPRKY